MSLDEYWNGDPNLVLVYVDAELMRIRRVQREQWSNGRYMMSAIAACLSNEASYFEEPLPATVQDSEEFMRKKREKDLERQKAAISAWVNR